MQYAYLGRSGQKVSRLNLGTLNFGHRTPQDESFAIMDAALERGINFFDTANDYGWQVHRGFTEELLGEWFSLGSGRRDKVVLGTKVFNPMTDWPNDQGLSARNIIASCEQSLRRMRTDWIDLYQMHHVDEHATWDEIWQAMETLTTQGKIRYAGSSNFAGWNIAAAQERADRRGYFGLISEQCVYNLVSREAEAEVLPAANAYGVAVLAWSPLHGGLLGGALRKLAEGTAVKSAQGRAQVALPRLRARLTEFESYCDELDVPPAGVALAWVLSRGVTAAVIGPRTMAHLDDAVRALDLHVSDELSQRLDKIFDASVRVAG
ncbi:MULTISPECIES: aldo/keto reductase [unclassified Amycolatopsis]|uniref:aldo/keto reductase n=1 Tax=unclassified Amycolatopsis TaxID=2618356 RepID=UPI001C696431|nr:aldo/keto reductase [Amycolatopsis sp. DSM 110486]QYN17794.1 aldo/keto reductase [Amycolatopsis sp. DSM 110486]